MEFYISKNISKLRLHGLQKQRTPSKVGITEYSHIFSMSSPNIMNFYKGLQMQLTPL